MESAQAPLEKLKINYVIYTKVQKIEQLFTSFVQHTKGWFIHFEGSRESICCGEEKPDIAIGDKFKITFEKVNHG